MLLRFKLSESHRVNNSDNIFGEHNLICSKSRDLVRPKTNNGKLLVLYRTDFSAWLKSF